MKAYTHFTPEQVAEIRQIISDAEREAARASFQRDLADPRSGRFKLYNASPEALKAFYETTGCRPRPWHGRGNAGQSQ